MEAPGQLTGGIAHDFNNQLQVMVGYLGLVQYALDRPDLDRERMWRSLESVQSVGRATTLIQQMLAFARTQRLEGRTLGNPVSLELQLQPRLWNSRLDPNQAEVALLSILLNARDAMAAGGSRCQVTITTAKRELDTGAAAEIGNLAAGRFVELAIADTGTGMPPEILARVVDPFFTTKKEGKGTGLSLSMVYGFAKQFGSALRIESEEAVGTTVRLFFPAHAGEERPLPQRDVRAVDRPGSEALLVVDDRADVTELARVVLDFGSSVLTASNGREALEVLDGA
ncbi:ATP-binding protein [Teichococcus vastitatis]|uniref:ATP-binding protein n=1 Tax=Teichococcus vastitatis TaxID=2307076 RepID=UPI00192E4856|nr:ATP-binding protein [Pseudoroseomonas vastitatis]